MYEKIKEAQTIVETLFSKYQNNNYMLLKTYNYICQQLPQQLEVIDNTQQQRMIRMKELTNEQSLFIYSFISKNNYFYIPFTESFFYYDKEHYYIHSEDDILHHVLTLITKETQLSTWKQRTKVYIMKRIKENNLLKSVPESFTIQHVISLFYPSIFASRSEAKYFLTILGDNIFKKNTELIHFLSTNAKQFIRELNTISNRFIGTNLYQTIKHKYHEHNYNCSRILNINDSIKNESIWKPILFKWGIDILCVACHYSNRYQSSDRFLLENSNDIILRDSVLFLQKNDPNSIVDKFILEYFQKNTKINQARGSHVDSQPEIPIIIKNKSDESNKPITSHITWKNMQYLWKHFLDSRNFTFYYFSKYFKIYIVQKIGRILCRKMR